MSEHEYENMAVVGQVADIVHDFKEASSYLKRIKERRSLKPPPRGLVVDGKALQDLEFSLSIGHDTVRKHYEREYRRLGQSFATGDVEAVEHLREIHTDMQRDLVATLKFAYQHDQHCDFLPLQDISDESQDKAVMCLMQLHQRVLLNVDANEIPLSAPFARRPPEQYSRLVQRPPPPDRNISSTSQGRSAPPPFLPELSFPQPPETLRAQLPTPEQSPSQETISYIRASPAQRAPFSPPQPLEMPSNGSQTSLSNLPTPPLDRSPGPPPSTPLPPLPAHIKRRDTKERQYETMPSNPARKETHSGSSFLDETFEDIDQWWDKQDKYAQRKAPKKPVGFVEPHPGTPVDPSKVDEPTSPRLIPLVPGANFVPSSLSPKSRSAASLSPQHLSPPMPFTPMYEQGFGEDRPSTANGSLPSQDNRLSTFSTATARSISSGQSLLSRNTSMSSGHSWVAASYGSRANADFSNAPNPVMPSSSLVGRSKSVPKVPEPIYETETPSQTQLSLSQMTLKSPDLRRPSAPATMTSGPKHQISAFPSIPKGPIMETTPPLTRRASTALSSHSANSSAPSATPAPMPIRTIAPSSLDTANKKSNLPSEANKYGGLCKASWRAQIGDMKKAYTSERRPSGVMSSKMIDYMKCKNCDFSGSAVLDAKKKRVPDRKIIIAKDTGLAYRWDFLFKSHLPVKGGTSSRDAEFGCMFCCSEGRGTPVFKGMNAFIAHVAEHRPGIAGNAAANNDLQIPEGAVIDRMDALVGRMMEPDDRWEVAFLTASGEGAYSDVLSTVLTQSDGRSVHSGMTSRVY